ncbi:TonB-dependent receptor [Sphingomonas solaris]|uniref:TonB-dependent receptor n=1 Tax=Alterirhizorhabdus solaris TaxID=2529389 RepID=A0A558R5Q4_9SPHN|nr:TonB-dependent receptor [Sphingomonas solaris]TVV74716.1 TonB-dependent receptor [Sphingomonas solaris]
MTNYKAIASARTRLLLGTAAMGLTVWTAPAVAQDTGTAAQNNTAQSGLADIVVTAQKREQSLQDVPIAITAVTEETLTANRVQSVTDLSGLAPGVTVRPAAGGSSIPTFSIRGATSYGVVPGSDKQVSIYLDGVYVSSPRGSIFDLPDLQRIEVLRGPQGTLFGRNATAGAISVSTRDPTGEFSARQVFSVGNYDLFRTRTTIDTPQFGPFSAYATFVAEDRDGDIRNLGAGTVLDRSAFGFGTATSPKTLGAKDTRSFFGALKFDPGGNFTATYKFDISRDRGTPSGIATTGIDTSQLGPLAGIANSIFATRNFDVADGRKRPKAVNNAFTIPRDQKVYGHNLTMKLDVSDALSLTNIASYRKSRVSAATQLDGAGGLTFPQSAVSPVAAIFVLGANPSLGLPANAQTLAAAIAATTPLVQGYVGRPFLFIANQNFSISKQYSNELQANYQSDFLTLTVGGVYFHGKDVTGNPLGAPTNYSLVTTNGGFGANPSLILPTIAQLNTPLNQINFSGTAQNGLSRNKATSLAAYAQAEFHVTDQLDLVGGARVTNDRKSGSLLAGTTAAPTLFAFKFDDTRVNYLAGANFRPSNDILLYAKYSTAFVTGGAVADITFSPETVRSLEGGVKADLFNRKLRTNLSVYLAKYKNVQTAQGGRNLVPARNELGTVIVTQGSSKVKGFEFEATAAPVRGVTVGASVAYTDINFGSLNPQVLATVGLTTATQDAFRPTLQPKWTGSAYAQYESGPLFGDVGVSLRGDLIWRDRFRTDSNEIRNNPNYATLRFSPAQQLVNARAALTDIGLGPVKAEVALWGRNLTNEKQQTFGLIAGFISSAEYQEARTYGIDVSFRF